MSEKIYKIGLTNSRLPKSWKKEINEDEKIEVPEGKFVRIRHYIARCMVNYTGLESPCSECACEGHCDFYGLVCKEKDRSDRKNVFFDYCEPTKK